MSQVLPWVSRRRHAAALAAAIAIAAVAIGCRETTRFLGATPAQAAENADAIAAALSARFGPLTVEQPLDAVRPKLARFAFAPSRLFGDSSVWTTNRDGERLIEIEGRPGLYAYVLRMRRGTPMPERATDSRAIMRLRQVGESDYEWDVRHELAIGAVRATELDRALTALLDAAGSASAPELRAAYRAAFPRTTAALGRLFTLDTLSVALATGGGALLTFGARMAPARMADSHPDYARYLDKYVSPARYRIELLDETGSRWAEAEGRDDFHLLRVRVHQGSLAPLSGPPRRLPDAFLAHVDFSMKALLVRVGVRGLVGDVTLTRTEHEKAFSARFRREPDWHFPPLVERMLRSPLRRPFEGDGALYGMAVRDSSGAPTVATRDLRLTVRESAIMRWLGKLGNTAMSDFRRGAEREAEQYYREVLESLRRDLRGGVMAEGSG